MNIRPGNGSLHCPIANDASVCVYDSVFYNMDSNNNPDDNNEQPSTVLNFAKKMLQEDNGSEIVNNDNGQFGCQSSSLPLPDDDSQKQISIAWHNVRYDHFQPSSPQSQPLAPPTTPPTTPQTDPSKTNGHHPVMMKNPFVPLKNALWYPFENHHRRGSVPTPSLTIDKNNNNNNGVSHMGANSSGYGGRGTQAPILRRLTGCFHYNTVNALLGPSKHARKTFVDCLMGWSSSSGCTNPKSTSTSSSTPTNHRLSGLSSDSKIYLFNSEKVTCNAAIEYENGGDLPHPPPPPLNISILIPKNLDECIFKEMFCKEILSYSFMFMNMVKWWNYRHRHIKRIIQLVGLDVSILNRRFDECSLGEQRSISIAQELMSITLPLFLYLDEPFIDLDSTMSSNLMLALKRLANANPITVIVSAQAPNAHLIPLFDKLYILAHGGVCIYSGPPNRLAQTLRQELHVYQCQHDDDDKRPPVEEMLKVSCLEFHNAKVRKLADQTLRNEHENLLSRLQHLKPTSLLTPSVPGKSFHVMDLLIQIYRQIRLLYHNRYWWSFPLKLIMIIIYYLFISFFLLNNSGNGNGENVHGTTWSTGACNTHHNQSCEQVMNDQYALDAYAMYHMYSMWFLASIAMAGTALFCTRMLRVFQHEHQNRRYSIGVFVISSTLIHFIDSILWSLITSILTYFLFDRKMLKLAEETNIMRMLYQLLNHWILFMYHQSYGMLLSVTLYQNRLSWNHQNVLLLSITQVIILMMQLLNNNIMVIVNHIHIQWLRIFATNFIAIRHVYDYAIQLATTNIANYNCFNQRPPRSIWIMLQRYSLLENNYEQLSSIYSIQNYLQRILPLLIIAFVIRIIAFWIIYFRFRLEPCQCCRRFIKKRTTKLNNNQTNSNDEESSLLKYIPIDYGPPEASLNQRKKSKVRIIQPIFKDDDEEAFCHDKIQLAWRKLSLFATSRRRTSHGGRRDNMIVRNLNGQFRLGTMNAVIGGRSKHVRTLLLRVFSGQMKTRLCQQTKFYESKYIQTNVCFISANASEEHLIPGLTAKQSLIYASTVKNIEDDFDGRLDHEEMALNILDELDLGHRAGSFVEDCSRCEQKRLALALELTSLQMPNFVCMDEPADGLDLVTAEKLIRCMRQLTDRHSITFVASFHSTNHQVLYQFDQLYCLGQQGACVYAGPPGAGIRCHLQEILPGIESYPLEELLKYSCMDNVEMPQIDQLIHQNDQKILEADRLLDSDTVELPKGIKCNVRTFSVIGVKRLARRYRCRWLSSLWFHWIMMAGCYLGIAVLLTGLFSADSGWPDGCVKMVIYNGSHHCPLHRTGTRMIWEDESHKLWDYYRYVHLASHLFLMVVLFHCSYVFYQELKRFITEHENGWFSSGVFYIAHNLFMDIMPMIPMIMFYVYILDLDNLPLNKLNQQSKLKASLNNTTSGIDPTSSESSSNTSSSYWWTVALYFIATRSLQSISHTLVCLTIGLTNRSEMIFWTTLATFSMFQITSNFQIRSIFPLSFLNVFKYLDESLLVLHYGYMNHCHKDNMISLTLQRIDASINQLSPSVHLKHCLKVLLGQTLLYRIMSWFALLFRANGDRIFHHHRLWAAGNIKTDHEQQIYNREHWPMQIVINSDNQQQETQIKQDDHNEQKSEEEAGPSRKAKGSPPPIRSSIDSTSTTSSTSTSSISSSQSSSLTTSSPDNNNNSDQQTIQSSRI